MARERPGTFSGVFQNLAGRFSGTFKVLFRNWLAIKNCFGLNSPYYKLKPPKALEKTEKGSKKAENGGKNKCFRAPPSES